MRRRTRSHNCVTHCSGLQIKDDFALSSDDDEEDE
jgi:hypothetical protein